MTGQGSYEVDENSLQGILSAIEGKMDSSPQAVLAFMEVALEILYQAAQVNCPVGTGGNAGALAASMERYVYDLRPGFQIAGKVTMMNRSGQQKPYAWMREKGGTIIPRPENKLQRLVWVNENGDMIFARQVTQQGSHYMEGALIQTKDEVLAEAGYMLNKFSKWRE